MEPSNDQNSNHSVSIGQASYDQLDSRVTFRRGLASLKQDPVELDYRLLKTRLWFWNLHLSRGLTQEISLCRLCSAWTFGLRTFLRWTFI
jgi:hypothetical protein